MNPYVHIIGAQAKRVINRMAMRLGFRIIAIQDDELGYLTPSDSARESVPEALYPQLTASNPRLRELRARYAQVPGPLPLRTIWGRAYLAGELQLPFFRADNAYVWQYRNIRVDLRKKYYLYARYIAERDPRGLLHALTEDGAFGCGTIAFHNLPVISRDLLDSINEIYFLDRALGLFERQGFTVLDIGAGYGRLAHRMACALPGLGHYYCTDAVPESTFLSEIYLQHRRCAGKTSVIPLDELSATLGGKAIDLAVNIHSFSEMGYDSIAAWLQLVAELNIPHLLIVPNQAEQLVSCEKDLSRRDFLPLLQTLGYRLKRKEPYLLDPDVQELVRIYDNFFLFERG